MIQPGDIIVADDDGVVAVPAEHARRVLKAAVERTSKEAASRERIASGELSFDRSGLRQYLAERGVVEQ